MDAIGYTALCEAVANRSLGSLGVQLGLGMAAHFPAAGISTDLRLAHFIAQAAEETGRFQWLIELGGPDYFKKYDGREDLGNTHPGDGYTFKGRGLFQITGRANYQKYGARLGIDLIANPGLAADPTVAVATASLYWLDHGLNNLADKDDLTDITKRINGGLNGYDVRLSMLGVAKTYLRGLVH